MFESIRQQYFPTDLIPGIIARPESDSSRFWSIIDPLMDEVFPAFKDIGAYEMPDDRWQAIQPLRTVFAATHHE